MRQFERGVDNENPVDDAYITVSHGSQLTVGCGFLGRMTRKQREDYLDGELGIHDEAPGHLRCTGFLFSDTKRNDRAKSN